MITNITLVNAVGGGNIGREINLTQIQQDLSYSSEYEPEHHPGLYFKLEEEEVTVMLFRSGEYHLSGGQSIDHLHQAKESMIAELNGMFPSGLDSSNVTFEVRNLVHTAEISKELNLSELSVGLGLNSVEYNPEQFPGLIYSKSDFDGTFLIFQSGKIILTGCKDLGHVDSAFDHLDRTIKELFNQENEGP